MTDQTAAAPDETTVQEAPDPVAIAKERAEELYEQLKAGAALAGREFILRQTPMDVQSAMLELVDADFPPPEPIEPPTPFVFSNRGIHPLRLEPGTPKFVTDQIAAQMSEYAGMVEQQDAAKELLENPADADQAQPPPSGTPSPEPAPPSNP